MSALLGPGDCASALLDLLRALESGSHADRLESARAQTNGDMVKHMQIVFPILTQIQAEVISRYGLTPDGEGLMHFQQHISLYEKEDPELARLNRRVKDIFIPPMRLNSGAASFK